VFNHDAINDDVIDITENYNFIIKYGVTTPDGHGVLKGFIINMNWDDPNKFRVELDNGKTSIFKRNEILSFDNGTDVVNSLNSLLTYRAIIMEK
jgi:hypothetical protein